MRKNMLKAVCTNYYLISLLVSTIFIIQPTGLTAQNQIKIMETNKQLIQKGFDQWADGSASFFDLLAEDVTWTITGNSPISKRYTSRKQFLEEAIAPLNERLSKKIIPTLTGLYADGDMVIALWDGKATAKDGIPYNNTYSWNMKIKGDKIIEVVAFFDTIDLAKIWERITIF